jgi:hypothetical protein
MLRLTFLRSVLAIENRKLCEDPHLPLRVSEAVINNNMGTDVSSLQAEAGLEKRNNLFKVTATFITLDQGRKLFCVYDDVETANLSLLRP